MKRYILLFSLFVLTVSAQAQIVGTSGKDNLIITQDSKTRAVIIVSPDAGKEPTPGFWQDYLDRKVSEGRFAQTPVERPWEKQAALDLQKYIERMSDAKPLLADTPEAIAAALKSDVPLFIVGEEALKIDPSLQIALDKVKKKNAVVYADAIVARRDGNRVYLAGTNDDAHYYAVAWILQEWGCRWYMPSEFGECVPEENMLAIGKLDYAYAPPFELRSFGLTWGGSPIGHREFLRRNMMNLSTEKIRVGHSLGKYVKDLIPEGGSTFNVPIATDATAEHVAKQVEENFAAGKPIGLGMNDGVYLLTDPLDIELQAGINDKFFEGPSYTDNFMIFYNKVCDILLKKYPNSKSLIGFLAYTNITVPPQREWTAAKPLIAYLAPIDIDPNHSMDSPQSPVRREYGEMMRRWAKVMEGRVAIYDYDQGMLVWRHLPNPSHMAFETDVKHYRDAGILGMKTESRGSFAVTFLNLYLRARLMWNPDVDVDSILDDFYPRFYGPAAAPMKDYWTAIYDAWKNTIVTEHEYFVIPAIYTSDLVQQLGTHLKKAQAAVASLKKPGHVLTNNEKQVLERMEFTQHGYDVLRLYTGALEAAGTDADYPKAGKIGVQAIDALVALSELNPHFTTGVASQMKKKETSRAWFPGEMAGFGRMGKLVNGEEGNLIQKTPLEWAFHRDPRDTGLPSGWAYKDADLDYWNAHKDAYNALTRKDYPNAHWSMLRTDSYIQAQGVRFSDAQNYTGYYWYKTDATFDKKQLSGKTHLMFPGLFNECWLYVNGVLASHRADYKEPWWKSGYKFEWDVDLSERSAPSPAHRQRRPLDHCPAARLPVGHLVEQPYQHRRHR